MHRTTRALSVLALIAALSAQDARAQQPDIVEITIAQAHSAMRAGDLTCRVLVQGYLDRIEAYDQAGPMLNSIQHVNPRSLELADSLDAVMASGVATGPMHCVPVLLKDQVETSDMPTTYGSALFEGWVSDRDATIVTRMKDAGAIILAKTNMGEFASRYVGSAFGIIRNAYDPTRNPSGSSGGTASGIAANMGLVGIGEDTGGSIRGPAAVSNLVGLRPTLQLVSTHGMMPANPTQDTMGPMTRTVTDAAILLDAIAGYDPNDPITAWADERVPETYTAGLRPDALRGVRIGVLRETAASRSNIDEDEQPGYDAVAEVMERTYAELEALGATLIDPFGVEMPEGIRRVGNSFETEEATDEYLDQLTDPPVGSFRDIMLSGVVIPWRARSMWGLAGKSMDDPDYGAVLRYREAYRVAVLKAMADHDVDAIVHATFDHPPTVIAPDVMTNPNPDDGYGTGDNRGFSPSLGFPALTVPAGFTDHGLPVGLEFLGRPFTEDVLLGFGYAFEQATMHRTAAPTAPPLGN